jgi:hypothetical protein
VSFQAHPQPSTDQRKCTKVSRLLPCHHSMEGQRYFAAPTVSRVEVQQQSKRISVWTTSLLGIDLRPAHQQHCPMDGGPIAYHERLVAHLSSQRSVLGKKRFNSRKGFPRGTCGELQLQSFASHNRSHQALTAPSKRTGKSRRQFLGHHRASVNETREHVQDSTAKGPAPLRADEPTSGEMHHRTSIASH